MFGYVKTDLPNMYVKDTVLYKAMYCGLCKSIGKVSGQRARLVLNYDLTFLSVLLHNILDIDVKVEKQRCVIHPIRKRPIALTDGLMDRIAALNVILAHYKLCDDVIDSKSGRLKRAFLNRAYKRAKKREPELDKVVCLRFNELLNYEKSNGNSIDFAADPFGKMMQEIVKILSKENFSEELSSLSYDLGKWIYLIDALDDFDKDLKRKNYNVFVLSYPYVKNKQQLIKDKFQDLVCVFSGVVNNIADNASKLKYKFNHDLIDNFLIRGLLLQTKSVMENKK